MKKLKPLLVTVMACLLSIGLAGHYTASASVSGNNELINLNSSGVKTAAGLSGISNNGRYILMSSGVSMTSSDTNSTSDLYIRDRQTNTTNLVSIPSGGSSAGGGVEYSSMSHDGRFVVFSTAATGYVSSDTSSGSDVYMRDTINNTTILISADSSGLPMNYALRPQVSADGRFVAFEARKYISGVLGDYNVYVRDTVLNTTELVSKTSSGNPGNNESLGPSISCDGGIVSFSSRATDLDSSISDTNNQMDVMFVNRVGGNIVKNITSSGNNQSAAVTNGGLSCDGNYISFNSSASNFHSGDTNGYIDSFRYSRINSDINIISADSSGNEGNRAPTYASLSGDGRYSVFASQSNNFTPSDTFTSDVFLKDLDTGIIQKVSINSTGTGGNAGTYSGIISSNGKYAAFWTSASNLVSTDTDNNTDILVGETGL